MIGTRKAWSTRVNSRIRTMAVSGMRMDAARNAAAPTTA